MSKFSKLTQQAIDHGYKSGLEHTMHYQLDDAGVKWSYETVKIKYRVEKDCTYTPDFPIRNKSGYEWILETKGRFLTADRMKHILIRQQFPDLDIRFVFTNANAKISKTSQTTYAKWCEKYEFKYATKVVPKEWFNE